MYYSDMTEEKDRIFKEILGNYEKYPDVTPKGKYRFHLTNEELEMIKEAVRQRDANEKTNGENI